MAHVNRFVFTYILTCCKSYCRCKYSLKGFPTHEWVQTGCRSNKVNSLTLYYPHCICCALRDSVSALEQYAALFLQPIKHCFTVIWHFVSQPMKYLLFYRNLVLRSFFTIIQYIVLSVYEVSSYVCCFMLCFGACKKNCCLYVHPGREM